MGAPEGRLRQNYWTYVYVRKFTQNVRLIRSSYHLRADVSQTGLELRTSCKENRNKHRQMLHRSITLIETAFPLYLPAFEGLFHPRISLNLVP